MGAPNVIFSITKNKISSVSGFDKLSVTFSADGPTAAFQCRATKEGEAWGVGVGTLIASFSSTPANTERTFDVYDDFLVSGDGGYRIGLYVQADDGSWNDTIGFFPGGFDGNFICADGTKFLCRKGDI